MTPETRDNCIFLTVCVIASYVMLFGLAVSKGFTIMSALFVAAIWLVTMAGGMLLLGGIGAAIGILIETAIIRHQIKKEVEKCRNAEPYKEPHDGGVIIEAEVL